MDRFLQNINGIKETEDLSTKCTMLTLGSYQQLKDISKKFRKFEQTVSNGFKYFFCFLRYDKNVIWGFFKGLIC